MSIVNIIIKVYTNFDELFKILEILRHLIKLFDRSSEDFEKFAPC